MKQTRHNFWWAAMLTAILALSLQSCDDEPYYDDSDWFAGRSFAAYSHPDAYNELWIIDFFWDGQFQISPCDSDGNVIRGLEIYTGNYTVDYSTQRIYLSYYGYSMNSMWSFTWWDQRDPYTGTYPDMEIYTTSGYGPLDDLTFTPF